MMSNVNGTNEIAQSSVEVLGDSVLVDLEDGQMRLPLRPLPEDKIEWIEQGRRQAYTQLLDGGGQVLKSAAYHLPMITTYSADAAFPFNCCNKGVGYIPKKEYVEEFIEFFQGVHERTRGKPWRESLQDRLAAAREFYFDREKIDYRAFATLEIFEKTTFANLQSSPLAGMLFTGDSPTFTSFQLNTVVEIIGQDDPRHTFIMLMRTLFESEFFHIHQPQFPYAYIFWICEVMDKTPFRVPIQPGKVQYREEDGRAQWEHEALEAIGRAPSLIQEHIKAVIEQYALQRGFTVITNELVQEAREQFMSP